MVIFAERLKEAFASCSDDSRRIQYIAESMYLTELTSKKFDASKIGCLNLKQLIARKRFAMGAYILSLLDQFLLHLVLALFLSAAVVEAEDLYKF